MGDIKKFKTRQRLEREKPAIKEYNCPLCSKKTTGTYIPTEEQLKRVEEELKAEDDQGARELLQQTAIFIEREGPLKFTVCRECYDLGYTTDPNQWQEGE